MLDDPPVLPSDHGTVGPIRLTAASRVLLRPAAAAVISDGFWAARRRTNREVSVPDGWDRLHEAGNFANLVLAAGRAPGAYVGELPFLDSDVHKWVEAVAWTLADPELPDGNRRLLTDRLAETEMLLGDVQEPDGYLDSHFQVLFPGERFVQLPWGHELYCAGHLIQAAVAAHRSTGRTELLQTAVDLADLVVRSFGTAGGQVDGVCGHPEIESALVELYRETGDERYLDRARYFVDRRGHGLLGDGRFGRQYWQDHVPVRDATAVAGHAVRQLYLLAGVADVYAETGEKTLLVAAERLWSDLVTTRTYLTGGVGSHHADEAFGDPYELPNERSYCETCAAIASIMFSWRMLMITGEARYADLMERTLYNGFLAGLSLDGHRYIYANPLQVRDGHQPTGTDADYERVPWFRCACCPPNVMRLLASLEHYVVLGADRAATVHQYVSGSYTVGLSDGPLTFRVATAYPWDGTIMITVERAPAMPAEIRLRIPAWAAGAELTVNGEPARTEPTSGWWSVEAPWRAGDELMLELPLTVRLTAADPRVDATRGCVALERGPLVYCVESLDHDGVRLDELVVDPTVAPAATWQPSLLGGVVTLAATGHPRTPLAGDWWPYRAYDEEVSRRGDWLPITAVPYFAWGNRGRGAMRVWLPTA